MTWKLLILYTFLASHLFALELFDFEGDFPSHKEPLIISLGSGCDTGLTSRNCGLRKAAFPFDWLVIGNHKHFISILDNDFECFTDENYFVPVDGVSDHPNSLLNTYYEIFFYHEGDVLYDWSDLNKYNEQLNRLKIKYERRIDRFRQLGHYPGKVFFIRNFTTDDASQAARHPELARELRDTLERYFPSLDFTLVIVTYTDVNAADIKDIDGVIEFKMNRPRWVHEYEKMYKILLEEYSLKIESSRGH